MDFLLHSMEAIHQHLGLPFTPPLPHPAPSPVIDTKPSQSPSATTLPLTFDPANSHVHHPHSQTSPAAHSQTSLSRHPPPEHDYSTQSGAEELLAQAYARFSPPFPFPSDAPPSSSGSAPQLALSPTREFDRPEGTGTTSFFGLLDDLIGQSSPEISTTGIGSRPMAERLIGSANLSAVGSQDPRMDVIKSGLISSIDSEVLIDLCVPLPAMRLEKYLHRPLVCSFHAHLAQHLCGFPLRLKA